MKRGCFPVDEKLLKLRLSRIPSRHPSRSLGSLSNLLVQSVQSISWYYGQFIPEAIRASLYFVDQLPGPSPVCFPPSSFIAAAGALALCFPLPISRGLILYFMLYRLQRPHAARPCA